MTSLCSRSRPWRYSQREARFKCGAALQRQQLLPHACHPERARLATRSGSHKASRRISLRVKIRLLSPPQKSGCLILTLPSRSHCAPAQGVHVALRFSAAAFERVQHSHLKGQEPPPSFTGHSERVRGCRRPGQGRISASRRISLRADSLGHVPKRLSQNSWPSSPAGRKPALPIPDAPPACSQFCCG